ncbi:MAG: UDP-Glycosyltransferase/glycogen phosphorylase [Herbaspirillum sp.]|jgi:glycosyltransferase involved in cell wall biosynthesis|nr:UDP-Glycosyltransferase/glycogen phosphorylase [Herbaspirillum sp.]
MLKIAQIAPLYEAVPPRLYGGTERVIAHLTDALLVQGHDVTLFASADTETGARLVPMRSQALRLDPNPLISDIASHFAMLDEVRRRRDEFDILHFHTDLIHFPFFEDIAERTLTTVHGRLDLAGLDDVYKRWQRYPLVSISDSQRKPLPNANWLGTVLHGIDEHLFRFTPAPEARYLAFLGRIAPEKRVDRAIAIAIQAGVPLRIAAKIGNVDHDYFDRQIRHLLNHPLIEYIGEIGDADKSEFLGNASALLFPIDWPEPFGLVMIEAMACGTPVIAWRHGAVPEVMEHGVTGFFADSIGSAAEAVRRIGEVDRHTVRHAFERRFTAETMAWRYVQLYKQLLRGRGEIHPDGIAPAAALNASGPGHPRNDSVFVGSEAI